MTENIVRDPEENFRFLVENNRDILTIRDADGRIRYTNPSFQTFMGYKPEQMIGTTGFDLLHPDDRAAVEQAMEQLWKNPGERGLIRCRARHAEGYWVSFEITGYNLLDDPDVRGVVVQGRRIFDPIHDPSADRADGIDAPKSSLTGKRLSGVLSTCASCKKIKDEKEAWQQIETYIRDRAPVEFSHGMCPECVGLWYPGYAVQ